MRLATMGIGLVSCVVSLAGPAAAPAAEQREREGFWLGLGAGWGSARATCDECGDGDREGGAAGYLGLGWTANERVLIGAEFDVWAKEAQGVTLNLYAASATVTFYPDSSSGFFLKGGAGASFVDTEIRAEGAAISADLGSGLGLIVGAGYDVPIGSTVSITPAVNFWYGTPGDLKIGGETLARNWSQSVFDLTVGITFH